VGYIEIADKKHRARLPEKQSNIVLSRQIGLLINGSLEGGTHDYSRNLLLQLWFIPQCPLRFREWLFSRQVFWLRAAVGYAAPQ
jgi:hypothetical protein